MYKYKYDIKCEYCGKFINTKDSEAMGYTPYGCAYDLEPPDERFICGKCVEKHNIEEKFKQDYLRNSSWVPLQKLFGGNQDD